MARMFGTDGVRGLANVDALSPDMTLKLGRAAVQVLAPEQTKPVVVVGCDPRLSGMMLEAALLAGLCSAGADVVSLGVVPTPAVAYLTRALDAVAGVMISASHNPYMDNGIKFFSAQGLKLDDAIEDEIEAALTDRTAVPPPTGADVGQLIESDGLTKRYLDFLVSTFAYDTPVPLRVGLDCAHGAASSVAPQLFKQLGAQVSVWHATPDGCNINEACGSLHPQLLQQKVVEEGLDVGFAFDGDADRLVAVDHTGRLLDGDYILAITARDLQERGVLAQNAVVSTVMANLGLDKALRSIGVSLHKTQVGDKYVMQGMREHGAVLGGEQSGHILFLNHHTTGDGLLSAVQVLNAMVGRQVPLADLAEGLQKFPQVLVNIRLRERQDPLALSPVQEALQSAEAALGHEGQILVRLSGTEPVARVMIEGPTQEMIEPLAQTIAQAIHAEIGVA